jgi:ligand-binding sensor domain-containing protein
MKPLYLFLVPLFFLFSCNKDDDDVAPNEFAEEIRFEISKHLAVGESVKCIEITAGGYYYSSGNKLNFISENDNNYSVTASSEILSLAYNSNEGALYLGTKESGLGKLVSTEIHYYTVEKNNLPRNLISQVVCDPEGNIWFNSSAHQLGGLVQFDGTYFEQYLPENSPLPENLIYKIQIRNGMVYLFTQNSKTGRAVFSVSGSHWVKLFETGGCFPTDMEIDSRGNIYYIEDSREYCGGGLMPDLVVFKYSGGEKKMMREHENQMNRPHLLRADERDYLWTAKFQAEGYKRLSVFDGQQWHEAPQDFPDEFIYCIEVDSQNNIWLGTSNGIYVLNQ